MDSTKEFRTRLERKSDGGFKFAITLIAVFISILIYTYNSFGNKQISENMCILIFCAMLPVFISLLYITSYIIISAISMEIECSNDKDTLQNIASQHYLSAFRFSIFIVCFYAAYLITLIPNNKGFYALYFFSLIIIIKKRSTLKKLKNESLDFIKNNWLNNRQLLIKILLVVTSLLVFVLFILYISTPIFLFLSIFPILIIFFYLFHIEPFKQIKISNINMAIFGIGVVITFLFVFPISFNQIVADMNSVYFIQDKQIPVDISVAGLPNEVYIELYPLGSVLPIDMITLQPDASISEEFLGKYNRTYLSGSKVGLGRYEVFINCSHLTEGNYKLLVTTENVSDEQILKQIIADEYPPLIRIREDRVINSFYLVDSNRTLDIR